MSSERRLRVLFLVDRMGYPDGSTHGGTTYFLEALPALQQSGVDLTVCFMAPRHPAAAKLEARGVKPIFLGRHKWDPRVIADVARIVHEHDIQVLHLASLKSLLIGRWVAMLMGRKAVVHLHDANPLPRMVGVLQRHAARWTHAALMPSSAMREYAAREWGLPPAGVEVLPCCLDTEPFRSPSEGARERVRREWGLRMDQPLVVLPGRIVPGKGQEDLIRATPELLRQSPDVAVWIVGDGEGRAGCEALVADLGLSHRIGFAGYRTDMPAVFAAADVIAIPSGCDVFGYVALEAMAAGRPVVAYRHGGLAEVLLDGQTGLLVPRGDLGGLARAIARVLEDAALARRLSEEGRRRAVEFSPQRHADRLLLTYERALSGRPLWSVPPALRAMQGLALPADVGKPAAQGTHL